MKFSILLSFAIISIFFNFEAEKINQMSWIAFSAASASTQKSEDMITELSGLDIMSDRDISIQLKDAKLATVIVFLSAVCPCSESHQPVLADLANEFSPKGIRFVGVHSNANETFEFTRNRFNPLDLSGSSKRRPVLPFPIIQDDKNCSIANNKYLNAIKTPHVFVIDPQLNILFRGGIDDSSIAQNAKHHYLRDALNAIVKGKEPLEKEVRVLGCEIKRP